jgi:hypothetical protein
MILAEQLVGVRTTAEAASLDTSRELGMADKDDKDDKADKKDAAVQARFAGRWGGKGAAKGPEPKGGKDPRKS